MPSTQIPVRPDVDAHMGSFGKAMNHLDNAATRELDRVDFDARLRELVRIRTSQLNGCSYCVDVHTRDALDAGESAQRIFALPVWAESAFFTERERAALSFTESVTRLANTHVPDADYALVAAYFDPDEVGALLALIVTINAWNAMGVATRAWTPNDD
ncbi:carboxymuconolactone decarboxylase family protein [Pedococcus bigeumensis]|uniref:Carboxymuconolactone decarboxylase family protein n=1 Tax=Pedococcus bigeumensis TaxID=433644 RepID=A0A502CZT5_9MICO|nr:carboxymuconolactone decarboxylase family protein [Pedococcus bigeumensis]TPG18184.1 carboxymuconolactone decarboxylase family protein [Pedococcus bigeumensis]